MAAVAWLAGGVAAAPAAPLPRVAPVDYFAADFAIERILPWGYRPDWSPDATRIVFTDAENDGQRGYAFELEVATRRLRCLTCTLGPVNGKVTRIYHLPDGNYLVTQGHDTASKSQLNAALYWLSAKMDRPPLYLGAGAMGDIAISTQPSADGAVAVAWGSQADDGRLSLTVARLAGKDGAVALTDRRIVYRYDAAKPGGTTFAEAYDFTDGDQTVVFFTVERPVPNGEMYRIDLRTGALTNLSRSPQHNETHRFPDQRFALEESNRASDPAGPLKGISGFPPAITGWLLKAAGVPFAPPPGFEKGEPHRFDLHVVAYDGSQRVRRLTRVSDLGGDAHQSEASPDGRRIIFCLEPPQTGPLAGQGGLYLGTFAKQAARAN